jgi:hypothetical protein
MAAHPLRLVVVVLGVVALVGADSRALAQPQQVSEAEFAALRAKAAEADQSNLAHLVAAYPDFLVAGEKNVVTFKDGRRLPFRVHDRPMLDVVASPDVADMFHVPYPLGPLVVPAPGIDAGRARNQAFLSAMYGDCRKGEVLGNLVEVAWLPKRSGAKLKITRINGVAEKLKAVVAELDALPDRFTAFLVPSAGTFNCRTIAGSARESAHGWGIAIDIATAHANYWRWDHAGPVKPLEIVPLRHRNAIPQEIVDIFEKHGFIWGGKWYHYDTMHFEYRPELLAAARKGP